MTDKEQIIIDGVDVSKCRYFRPGSALTCSRMYGGACDNKYSNELCYFKQLAHKTQECEELKQQLEFVRTHRTVIEAECDRYRKALEEIEELATNLRTRTDYHSVDEVNADIDNVLNIIKKAKGEE